MILSFMFLLIEFPIAVGAQFGGGLVYFRTEVAQQHQWFGVACVFKSHARFCPSFGAEVFILSQLVEADELRAVQRLAIDGAFALHADATPSAFILDSAFSAGIPAPVLAGN